MLHCILQGDVIMSLGREICCSPEGNVCSRAATALVVVQPFFFSLQKAAIKKLSLLVYQIVPHIR